MTLKNDYCGYLSSQKRDAYFGFARYVLLTAGETVTIEERAVLAKQRRITHSVPGTHLAVTPEVRAMRM